MIFPPQFADTHLSGQTPDPPCIAHGRAVALLRSGALQMMYQPILDLRTGGILKIEALARLLDDEDVLLPASFLPHLDPEHLLELYVLGLDQALQEQRNWLDHGKAIGFAINVPPDGLDDPRYYDATVKALARHDRAPQLLTLEILESEGLSDTNEALTQFNRFRTLGVCMAEDDLGYGHSSLIRLRRLPFDCIKIDRDIVAMSTVDDVDALHFVYQLTRLGHALGKTVIVEGVDSVGLIDAIGTLGADGAQGYAVARPMPARQLSDWLENRQGPPSSVPSSSAPGRLAHLVVAEERLLAGGQDFPVVDLRCAGLAHDSAYTCMAQTCRTCRLARFRDEVHTTFGPLTNVGSEVNELLQAATRDGVSALAYRTARRKLAAAM
ncbi:EAL domain-containing protein (putative c-di-GMP-specific phosphodiesterase class I) [Cupriavidus metallidurans]|nr:EAL domain-containing protein [Cupriavidus metallidurans]MDE4917907.1 EAL domain-containing protein [Cupriavidus metallidurans]UBM12451.1 EAL domain-containing protein [Cupriavidus metallidurans]